MADPFIGEIRIFTGTFAPQGWFFCWGQELLIQSYQPLFAVIGNRYGGDGTTKFKLPDYRGRVLIGQGVGPGLTPRAIAAAGGITQVTLNSAQVPSHTHQVNCRSDASASTDTAANAVWGPTASGKGIVTQKLYAPAAAAVDQALNAATVKPAYGDAQGNTAAHTNCQPYLGINFIICYDGEWPEHP